MENEKRYRKYIKTGIYKITCSANNKVYIGSAVDLTRRQGTHLSRLNLNKHHSIYLQRSYNKYGRAAFKWEILEFCDVSQLLVREQYYMDLYQTHNPKIGFNVSKVAGSSLGVKMPQSHRDKMSILNSGIKNTKADKEIYHFVHSEHGEEFCTRQDLATKYKLSSGNANSLGSLIKNYRGRVSVQGWYIGVVKPAVKVSARVKKVDVNKVVQEYLAGDSAITIALRVKVSEPTVFKILERQGIKNRNWREGQTIKLNLKIPTVELIAEYENGKSMWYLGRKYKISDGSVQRILLDGGVEIRKRQNSKSSPKQPCIAA